MHASHFPTLREGSATKIVVKRFLVSFLGIACFRVNTAYCLTRGVIVSIGYRHTFCQANRFSILPLQILLSVLDTFFLSNIYIILIVVFQSPSVNLRSDTPWVRLITELSWQFILSLYLILIGGEHPWKNTKTETVASEFSLHNIRAMLMRTDQSTNNA